MYILIFNNRNMDPSCFVYGYRMGYVLTEPYFNGGYEYALVGFRWFFVYLFRFFLSVFKGKEIIIILG